VSRGSYRLPLRIEKRILKILRYDARVPSQRFPHGIRMDAQFWVNADSLAQVISTRNMSFSGEFLAAWMERHSGLDDAQQPRFEAIYARRSHGESNVWVRARRGHDLERLGWRVPAGFDQFLAPRPAEEGCDDERYGILAIADISVERLWKILRDDKRGYATRDDVEFVMLPADLDEIPPADFVGAAHVVAWVRIRLWVRLNMDLAWIRHSRRELITTVGAQGLLPREVIARARSTAEVCP
jgi:hypothetical protein